MKCKRKKKKQFWYDIALYFFKYDQHGQQIKKLIIFQHISKKHQLKNFGNIIFKKICN